MKRNPLMYLLVVAVCLYLLYSFTTGSDHDMPFRASTESRLTQSPDRNTESSNFRQTTPEEIAHSIKGGHAVHPDIEKEQLIKDLATEKQPASVSSIAHSQNPAPAAEIEEQSVAGRKMMPKVQQPEKPKYPVTTDEKPKFVIGEEPARNGGKTEKAKDPATLAAESELDEILKRSPSKRMPFPVPTIHRLTTSLPVIIFSKSHCPFSARAKHLLLQTYSITPAPHVVELDLLTSPLKLSYDADADTITMGRKIQDLLAEWTGRRTVPNVLVNARSIGGSDDIAHMESEGKLVEEIKHLGLGRVREMVKKDGDN
jgi:glutaredoxin